MKIALITIAIWLFVFFSYGQSMISGRIMNEENKPLEFVTIGIKKDSAIFKTAFTDSLGNYTILNITPLKYKLVFYCIGYKTVELAAIIAKDTTINMVLAARSQELNEVIVLGNSGVLERKPDRFVFSVANSEITKGNTIYEVLKQTPLISVNENNNAINLINKSQTVVYINGKKSNLSQEAIINLLKNNNADNLSRIEIIIVPSSSYNVQGNTGIINIVMKQDQLNGINGSCRISDRQAFYNWQSASTNINYRKNKLGINANVYANNVNKRNDFDMDFLFKENNYSQTTSTSDFQPQLFYGGSIGMDYDINTKQTLGLKMNYSLSAQKNANSSSLSKFKPEMNPAYDSLQQTQNTSDKNISEVNLNANYHFAIDSTGKFFNMDVDYLSYSNNQVNYNVTDLINQNYDLVAQRQKFKQIVPQNIKNVSAKIEYQHVFDPENNLNIGVDGSVTNTDNDTYFGNFINNDYQKDSSKSYYYTYNESIYSLFATYSRTWNKKWQSSAGLRLENTTNDGEVKTTRQSFTNNYLDLLPYVAISFLPSEKNQLSYTLSNRISRPAFWELNPFRYYTTPNFYMENNPFLQPQKLYINELSYTLNNNYTFLVDYTHTDNASEQLFLTENNSVKAVRLNYGTNEDVSASVSTQQFFFNKLIQSNISLSGGVIKYKGRAENIIIDNEAPYFNTSINSAINISTTKKWFGFLNISYNSPTKLSYGHLKSTNNISFGIKKRYKNWAVSLWVYDVLIGEQLKYTREDDQMIIKGITNYDSRSIYLSLSYQLGNQQLKANRERETSNTETIKRTQR